jgi:hypothetical protein
MRFICGTVIAMAATPCIHLAPTMKIAGVVDKRLTAAAILSQLACAATKADLPCRAFFYKLCQES